MAIRGQGLRQMAPLHNYKGQAVGEAPVFVGPRPMKSAKRSRSVRARITNWFHATERRL
jgi:hypothetical protein